MSLIQPDPPPMIPTTINGKWELLLPQHRAERAEWETGWERERLDSMHANLKPGDVIYDVGSEEGDLPALFARWVAGFGDLPEITGGPSDRMLKESLPGGVALFEPNPRVWPNIRAIFEANGIPRPLLAWSGFAGDSDRLEPEPFRDGWPESSYGPLIGDHGFCQLNERPDLPSRKIDTVVYGMGVRAPTAITMDVEGSELSVLRGAERVLREMRPMVWVSVHPEFMRIQYGVSDSELFEFMAGCGYYATHLATDHEQHWVFCPEERELADG